MEIHADSPIDGLRSVIIERNNRRRDLIVGFQEREYCREFLKIINRMDSPPAIVQRDRNKVQIKFRSDEEITTKSNRQQAKVQEAYADASS